jgi:hypothetical protein
LPSTANIGPYFESVFRDAWGTKNQSEDGPARWRHSLLLLVLIMSLPFSLTSIEENVYILPNYLERTYTTIQRVAASLQKNQSGNNSFM